MKNMNFKEFQLIKADFEFLENWEERYSYIIDLGREMPPLDQSLKSENNKLSGCASQVWLILGTYKNDGIERLSFLGDSDALIVKGLIAIVGSIYDNISFNDISKVDPYKKFESLELLGHLSSQRANGLNSMIKKIQDFPNV
tara:strand:+ start:1050 stop:1475 length:426 start_codon:yes stop_codon:yes gene_type:complete